MIHVRTCVLLYGGLGIVGKNSHIHVFGQERLGLGLYIFILNVYVAVLISEAC